MKYFSGKIIIASAIIAISAMYIAPAARAADIAQPSVDREASEEAFLKAYDYFIQNRPWDCLDELAESIKQNVYFVDVYYMRSLALRRLGRYTDAIDAMSQYLEVRRDDSRARMILDTMRSEWGVIREAISPEDDSLNMSFESHTVNAFPGIRPYSPLALKGMYGMGKISASDESIIACDTLGDTVWIFDRGGKKPAVSASLERPVVAI
ncbi:MAG: hypothetical protein LBU26_03720, partial [Synergistaceae bacterium]|nr:hypothetical protein [Synergistaceae bacterium]